jgi:hypothetical protein
MLGGKGRIKFQYEKLLLFASQFKNIFPVNLKNYVQIDQDSLLKSHWTDLAKWSSSAHLPV